MKLSVIKKLQVELLPPDVRTWFSQVAAPLNSFLDQSVRALTNQLTVRDNFKSQVNSVTIEGAQTYPIRISYKLNEAPVEVRVGQIYTNDGTALSVHSFSWKLNNGTLELTFNGLSSVKHTATIISQV